MKKNSFSLKMKRYDLIFFPFLKDIKEYRWSSFQRDLFASISIALIAIPQSIAYSLLANLPASAGLFSAIFGVIISGFFCSCPYLVTGPTTGVAILLQSVILNCLSSYYPGLTSQTEILSATLHIVAQVIFIMGVLQILAAFCKLGKLLQFVSRSVVLGYFAGVVIAIIVNQAFFFFGIPTIKTEMSVLMKFWQLILHFSEINWVCVILGSFAIGLLIVIKKFFPRLPYSLFMLIIIGVVSYLLNRWFSASMKNLHIPTLEDFSKVHSFSIKFILPIFDVRLISKIFPTALAITLLSILEVFSVSRSLSVKGGIQSRANQEIYSVGLANLFLSFLFGSMPSSGSVSRSSLMFMLKAKTRFSAIISGFFIAILSFFCMPWIQHIPLTSLAAILFLLVPSLIYFSEIKLCFLATKGDGVVFLLTMISCLIFSLDVAFFIGIIISIGFYLSKAADPHMTEYAFNASGRLTIISPKDHVRRYIRIIGIGKELFFGIVDLLQSSLQKVADDPYVKVIVLRLNSVHYIDASMCFALLRLHEYLRATNRHLVISGITEEVWKVLYRSRIVDAFGRDNLFLTDETKPQLSTWRACLRAEELLRE